MSTIAIGDKAEDNNWQIDGSLQSRIASEVTRGLHWFWSSTPLEQPVGATLITFYRGPIDCREWGPVESDGAPSLLSAADHLRRETSKTYCVWVKISFCLFVLRYKLIISFCRRYWDSINIKEFNNAMQTQGWRHDKGLPAARYLPSLFHTLYPFVHCMLHTFVDAFSLTS